LKNVGIQNPSTRPDFRQIIEELDVILINVAVKDTIGRQFWRLCFLGKEEVAWDLFREGLIKFLSLPIQAEKDRVELNFKCLKLLVVSRPPNTNREFVTLNNWGKILQFFGPIIIPAIAHGETFLDEITNYFRQPWFHGDTDGQRAIELLSGKPSGTFMLRFSNSVEGWYTISQIQGNVIQHQRISHVPGGSYLIEDDSYSSLYELISKRGLNQPCEGSRYNREVSSPETKPDTYGYKEESNMVHKKKKKSHV